MAGESNKSVVLLSIQPKFAQMILNGQKRVEFRKTKFRREVSHVVLYVSTPIQKVIGYFEISYLDEDSPRKLWSKYYRIGGILYDEFSKYFESSKKGLAIGIGKIRVFTYPKNLFSIDTEMRAPQSYLYLAKKDFNKITKYKI